MPSSLALLALVCRAVLFGRRYYHTRREAEVLRERMLVQERAAHTQLEESNKELSAAYDQTRQAQQQAEEAAVQAQAAAQKAEEANRAKSAFRERLSGASSRIVEIPRASASWLIRFSNTVLPTPRSPTMSRLLAARPFRIRSKATEACSSRSSRPASCGGGVPAPGA